MATTLNTVVDLLYLDFQRLLAAIDEQDISLQTSLRVTFSRSLYIASASYFEEEIERQLIEFIHNASSGSDLIKEFVRQKGFGRQYHSLFEWERKNVNRFFGLFGNDFSRSMQEYVKNNSDYQEAISAFLEIGVARNSIAHKDYFKFPIDTKTTEEVYATYRNALAFVTSISGHLMSAN